MPGLFLAGVLALLLTGCKGGGDDEEPRAGQVRHVELSTLALVTERGSQRAAEAPAPDIETIAREEEAPRRVPEAYPAAPAPRNAIARAALRFGSGG